MFPPCLSPITLGNGQQKAYKERTMDPSNRKRERREREERIRDYKEVRAVRNKLRGERIEAEKQIFIK